MENVLRNRFLMLEATLHSTNPSSFLKDHEDTKRKTKSEGSLLEQY